jgi:hypothetical protein
MAECQLWVFPLHGLCDDLSPKSGRSEDVGFIDRVDWKGWVGGEGDLSCDSGDSLDFGDGVDHGIPCYALFILFLPLSKVYSKLTLHKLDKEDVQRPPTSSRRTMMSVPFAISGLRGEYCNKASEAKLAGRMFAYRSRAFRSLKIPCSGRTGPTPHLGPPTAPTQISSTTFPD